MAAAVVLCGPVLVGDVGDVVASAEWCAAAGPVSEGFGSSSDSVSESSISGRGRSRDFPRSGRNFNGGMHDGGRDGLGRSGFLPISPTRLEREGGGGGNSECSLRRAASVGRRGDVLPDDVLAGGGVAAAVGGGGDDEEELVS